MADKSKPKTRTGSPPDASADDKPVRSAPNPLQGFWYFVLLPAGLLYTVVVREMAGAGYTSSPNQNAMVVFFLAQLAWPAISLIPLWVIQHFARIRGVWANLIGFVAWALSCAIPFWIGMK